MIKLCYKEYDYKLNLSACKAFHEQTGKDLTHTLLRYLDACRTTKNMETLQRLEYFFGIEKFDVIAKAFHCLIKQENKNIPLVEIEDAMFRVNWIPNEEDSDLCEPWPLVMVDLATQVNDYYTQMSKKKADT